MLQKKILIFDNGFVWKFSKIILLARWALEPCMRSNASPSTSWPRATMPLWKALFMTWILQFMNGNNIIFLQLQVQPYTVPIFSFQPRVFPFYHTCKVFVGVKPKMFCKLTSEYFIVLKLKFPNKTVKREKPHLVF